MGVVAARIVHRHRNGRGEKRVSECEGKYDRFPPFWQGIARRPPSDFWSRGGVYDNPSKVNILIYVMEMGWQKSATTSSKACTRCAR
jgi:hypothetical protein